MIMKIAVIMKEFPVLSQSFILNHITGLIDLGCDVDIYSEINPKEQKMHTEVKEYDLINKTFYFDEEERMRKKESKDFLQMFLRKRYDIIHCHFGLTGNNFIFLKDSLGKTIKFITSFHGYDATRYPGPHHKGMYNEVFQKSDMIIANSKYIKQRLVSLGCKDEKICKLPACLNIAKFSFKARKCHLAGKVNILTIARLVEKKGIEYSIRAIAKAIESYPNISYFIIGEGPLRENLERLIINLNCQEKIKLLGAMTHEELMRFYKKSHIFVLSSVTASDGNQEGQGLVLQEAQAVGLPVIATRHNGIPEGVVDGKAGFLVPEKDVDALKEKIIYLIEHPELWEKMGAFGRKFVERNYDILDVSRKLYKIYQDIPI